MILIGDILRIEKDGSDVLVTVPIQREMREYTGNRISVDEPVTCIARGDIGAELFNIFEVGDRIAAKIDADNFVTEFIKL